MESNRRGFFRTLLGMGAIAVSGQMVPSETKLMEFSKGEISTPVIRSTESDWTYIARPTFYQSRPTTVTNAVTFYVHFGNDSR